MRRWIIALVLLLLVPCAMAQVLVPAGSIWKYLDNGSDQGTAWRAPNYDDSTWKQGPAILGYGNGNESTVVGYGPNPQSKFPTTYFRRTFEVTDAAAVTQLQLGVKRDDGAVVYLNGVEVWRSNMPAGLPSYLTFASGAAADDGRTWQVATIGTSALRTGVNVLAAEVHQSDPASSDIAFDLRLDGSSTPLVTRGPYLQLGTPTSVRVQWRTNLATDGQVRYGPNPSSLNGVASDAVAATDHAITLAGLSADTRYCYSIGTRASVLAGGDEEHCFVTAPAPGGSRPTRIWVIGDAGTGDARQTSVRDAYQRFTGTRPTDLWLQLGDNAYDNGTDAEYQKSMFDIYAGLLRKSVTWPTIGNHDVANNAKAPDTAPFFQMFTRPAAGQAGGVPSGTNRYYSFDFGNIHFINLDSMTSARVPGSPMLNWLQADLAANTKDWTFAYWHHPAYSKGSHDSDLESASSEMRSNVLPLLEAFGVDLVMYGHSHVYERSFLIDGHYGLSTSFLPSMIKNGGSGRPSETGAYLKPSGPLPHQGTVYITAGASGALGTGSLNYPGMYLSTSQLGSLVLDIDRNRLDVAYVTNTGMVRDSFSIIKGSAPTLLVGRGSVWRFHSDGTDPGTAWRGMGFSDSGWASGQALLGYGDPDIVTTIPSGPSGGPRYATAYFRRSFNVVDAAAVNTLTLKLLRDDGAVVYLNGVEVARSNMPAGAIGPQTLTPIAVNGSDETTYHLITIPKSALVTGTNVLAVEVHQQSVWSSDLRFDLELLAQ